MVEMFYCETQGHKFIVVKDVHFKNKHVPYDGVKILVCKRCKRTKMMWYINK